MPAQGTSLIQRRSLNGLSGAGGAIISQSQPSLGIPKSKPVQEYGAFILNKRTESPEVLFPGPSIHIGEPLQLKPAFAEQKAMLPEGRFGLGGAGTKFY